MPTYKELWYADVNTPINPSVISATEATSVGDVSDVEIETVQSHGSISQI